MRMPVGGCYFDNINRQRDLTGHAYNAREDYKKDFVLMDGDACAYYERASKQLRAETDCAVFSSFFPSCLGDFFQIPGAWIDSPQGVRTPEEWMVAHVTEPDYVKECYELQTEVGLKNLALYLQAVADRVDVIGVSATDFGSQQGPLISPDFYREFYLPYHKRVNDWIHQHTPWKTFLHTCGSIQRFLPDFIAAGFDIVNPVQMSARNMDVTELKSKFGARIAFWGGGADPQHTVPFGTAEEVAAEVRRNVSVLSRGGGFVLANVHNIQSGTPPENIIALFGGASGS
jgi:hypothetical protein